MSDTKKKRMSLLDNIAAAGSAAPSSMMTTNRALRSARDAVDSHRVWELDPEAIDDTRFKDRLNPADVADLKASIEANGQSVPILVRRDPQNDQRYLLVYGRRRLEAVRSSDKVHKVRALIASMDDSAALRAQVTENTARRDLSYIERALFAQELQNSGFGTQTQIAEVLNTTKSAISMALSLANGLGDDLVRAIGPAHGIGRPRWEALLADLNKSPLPRERLIEAARAAHDRAQSLTNPEESDPSVEAFLAVLRLVDGKPAKKTATQAKAKRLTLNGRNAGKVEYGERGLKLEVKSAEPAFLQWLEASAQSVLEELHARWKQQA